MTTINLLSRDEIRPTNWKGGLTFEYFIYPQTAMYAERDFLFRLSSASIDIVPSEFTRFDGYCRYLVMLDQELKLVINREEHTYAKEEIIKFQSGDSVTSYIKGMDFNWMVSNKITGHNIDVVHNEQSSDADIQFLFALEPGKIIVNNKKYNLLAYDLLIVENIDKVTLSLRMDNKMLFGQLNF